MSKAREPAPTVAFIDDYCAHYQPVFPNVRQFEQFTRLELGLVAETKRKSLPRLAQATFAQRRQLVELLIDRVVVTNGDVEIRYVIPTSPASVHVRFSHLRTNYLERLPGTVVAR